MCGFTEPLVRRKPTAPLDSTSCRRLGVSITSLRRCDGEGSLSFCWGLANSVKPKEKFRISKGKRSIIPNPAKEKPPSYSPEGESEKWKRKSEKFIPDGKPLTLDFRPLTFDFWPDCAYHRMQFLANSSEEMRWYKKVFRKEIRIIRIISPKMRVCIKTINFWYNYFNYSNFFPK